MKYKLSFKNVFRGFMKILVQEFISECLQIQTEDEPYIFFDIDGIYFSEDNKSQLYNHRFTQLSWKTFNFRFINFLMNEDLCDYIDSITSGRIAPTILDSRVPNDMITLEEVFTPYIEQFFIERSL